MGFIGFLHDFEFYMPVLGVLSGPIGFVAPLRFKILDSQPDSSNMGLFPTESHEITDFLKSRRGFRHGIYRVFGLELPNQDLRAF